MANLFVNQACKASSEFRFIYRLINESYCSVVTFPFGWRMKIRLSISGSIMSSSADEERASPPLHTSGAVNITPHPTCTHTHASVLAHTRIDHVGYSNLSIRCLWAYSNSHHRVRERWWGTKQDSSSRLSHTGGPLLLFLLHRGMSCAPHSHSWYSHAVCLIRELALHDE